MEDEVNHRTKWFVLMLALALILAGGACKKKVAPTPPPPPPPPPQPTATISVSPESVQKGQSATITWSSQNASEVNIDGIGKVDAQGSQSVTPSDSTTYHMTAKGPGGSTDATARVTVTTPPPPPPTPQPTASEEQLFSQNVKDVFFDYDKYDIRADGQSAIQGNAAFLQQHPNVKITIEGHCDERGSTEYNLALGDNRASTAKTALVSAGISADRIKTISYGKEKPACTESTEACWQQNRRAHFVYGQK